MSSKANNHQVISAKIMAEILECLERQEAKDKAEKDYSSMIAKLTTRKAQWIDSLISEMKNDAVLSKVFLNLGEREIKLRIFADTDKNQTGGKVYSSISSALNVWQKRFKIGEFAEQKIEYDAMNYTE